MKIGHQLQGRYTIEKLIGEGATATVYLARDERLGRQVAIKVLLPYVKPTAKARFTREAQSAAALNHPNIMAIYDEVEDEEYHFLVVEYIEGTPLSDFIPSAPDVAVSLGLQVCSALEYAHRMNIIHRDIKPANVIISNDGLLKIMDFGLAMARDAKHITAHGSIIGTPAYLSPEQARGHALDHRTDLYSLGVLLYELSTGRLPFDTNDISALLLQKVSNSPIPPQELNPAIPDWLNATIMRALEREPDNRFQSAAEFAQALGKQIPPSDTLETAPPIQDLAPAPSPTASPKRPIRMIVADDHVILRTSIAFFLDDQPDIEVVAEAGSGTETLRLMQAHQPDLLLLDLNMPDRSGMDILPQVRQECPNARVLVLTGRTEDAFVMRALQAGAHGYLLKTSSQEELLDAVHRVASGNMALGTDVTEKVVNELIMPRERMILSDAERNVLLTIVGGAETNEALANKLGCTEQEVIEALSGAIDKLGAHSRAQAALMALRLGWITIEEAHQR
ncbi:MAG: protein kinase [Anaerolineae bacterium]|nr:protein kinase [Anaerolineae bacterium]